MAKTSRPDRKNRDRDRGRRRDREPSEYEESTLAIDRVTRVVKGGRRLRFRAVVVVGNKKGKVGLGTGKAGEVQAAVQKATRSAKRHLIMVPMQEGTIPHEVNIKHKAVRLRLMPASKGTGIIAGGPLRTVLDLSGVKDALAKYFGSDNKLVCAQAAVKALTMLRGSKRAVASEPVKVKPKSEIPGHPEENLPIKQVQMTEQDKKALEEGPRG